MKDRGIATVRQIIVCHFAVEKTLAGIKHTTLKIHKLTDVAQYVAVSTSSGNSYSVTFPTTTATSMPEKP